MNAGHHECGVVEVFVLRELSNVTQDETFDGKRRWFNDDDMDLIVWVARSGEFVGFQLCYDIQTREHSLTWHRDRGFVHNKIDAGETDPSANRTPILVSDGAFPMKRVDAEFAKNAANIDPVVVGFVRQKLALA
jgi:hypothetical protein